jgi:hypothetical protein
VQTWRDCTDFSTVFRPFKTILNHLDFKTLLPRGPSSERQHEHDSIQTDIKSRSLTLKSHKSAAKYSTCPLNSPFNFSKGSPLLATRNSWWPFFRRNLAIARPIPRLAPVRMMLLGFAIKKTSLDLEVELSKIGYGRGRVILWRRKLPLSKTPPLNVINTPRPLFT